MFSFLNFLWRISFRLIISAHFIKSLGTGLHRYVLLAYEQSALISPQYSGIAGFNVQDFVSANNLKQPPLAGNFFRAQDDSSL